MAELYLGNKIEENERKVEADKTKREQANIQSQQETAKQAAEDAAKMQADKLEAERIMQEFISNNKKQEILLERGLDIYKVMLTPKTGDGGISAPPQKLPPALEMLLNQTFQNIALTLAQDNKEQQQQIMAQAQQEEMMAQQEEQAAADQEQNPQQQEQQI